MNLYEINYEIEQLLEGAVDEETGEINEEVWERLDELNVARNEKIENIACYIKNLKADVEGFKSEIQSLQKRQKTASNKMERLENYLHEALNGQKFSTSKVAVSYRHNTKVECEDLSLVPEEYLRYASPELNKTAVKQAIKDGIEVKGCSLVETESMVIK